MITLEVAQFYLNLLEKLHMVRFISVQLDSLFTSFAFSATHIIVDVAQTNQQKKKDNLPLLAFA